MLSVVIPSVHSYPAVPLARQLVHQRHVHSGPLVLGTAPLKYPAPTVDRDRTVSRRSEPSSRNSLIGEQPNPWDRLQPQDELSRHRGAKHRRRCELLGGISLLSPEYLLSVKRWLFHSKTTGSLRPTFVSARDVSLAVKLPFTFTLVQLISIQLEGTFVHLRYTLGGDRPSQTARLTLSKSFHSSC